MIKNCAAALLAAFLPVFTQSGCSRALADPPRQLDSAGEVYQGVAELEERQLAFEVSGTLTELAVAEGDLLTRGQLLAKVDDALDEQSQRTRQLEAEAALAQSKLVDRGTRPEQIAFLRAKLRAAQTRLDLLDKQVKRERELFQRAVTSESALEQLTAELEQAAAERDALASELRQAERGNRSEEKQVASARAQAAQASVVLDDLRIERHELRAAFPAIVLDVHRERGEVVVAGAPVLTVAEPDRVYAEIFVPQAKLSGITVGAQASARADGLAEPLQGTVQHISRRTEFTPRYLFSERERPHLVVRVKVRLDDPKRLLNAGVPVFVSIGRTPADAAPAAR